MNRSVVGWIVAAVVVVAGGALAWVWFAGGSGEPSTELTTPAIAAPSTTEAVESSGSTTEAAVAQKTFVIDSSQSSASFEIDEVLRGSPKHVIGSTDQVAGQVQVDINDLSSAQFSEIIVNARTFRTDAERRDRAIRGPIILNSASDEYEFITFTVTSLNGLTGSVEQGGGVEFSITGDLNIKDATNEVTFSAEVFLVDENTIKGGAMATVLRSDFDIGIPSVPGVADVTDEVVLTLEFVAVSS